MVILGIRPGDEILLVEMGHRMWSESKHFRSHPLNRDKLRSLAAAVSTNPLLQCFVAWDGDHACGLWCGMINELWYSRDLVCNDIVYFVDIQYRGSSAAYRLLLAAETWAKGMGATENSIGLSSGVDVKKTLCFFEKMGYTHKTTLVTKGI